MNVVEDRNTRIRDLEQRISILEQVCAEAYQLAGAVGAPEKVFDNLAAAAQGMPIPHATFLPVSAADCDESSRADTPAAISGRAADTLCCD
jgi:hypothetical protein